jgi:hypothetical protein
MRIFFWIGIGSFWIIQGLVATPVHASQTLMIDDLEAKGGCRALSMQTFDSELAKARFTLSVGRGIPKVFGSRRTKFPNRKLTRSFSMGPTASPKNGKILTALRGAISNQYVAIWRR